MDKWQWLYSSLYQAAKLPSKQTTCSQCALKGNMCEPIISLRWASDWLSFIQDFVPLLHVYRIMPGTRDLSLSVLVLTPCRFLITVSWLDHGPLHNQLICSLSITWSSSEHSDLNNSRIQSHMRKAIRLSNGAMYGDPHWLPGPVRAISIPIQPVRWLCQSP